MRNILLVFLIFITSTSYTYSNWYGNHAVGFTSTSGTTNCSADTDSLGGPHPSYGHAVPAAGNSTTSTTAHGATVTDWGSSGNLRCLYRDNYDPEDVEVDYTAGWYGAGGTTITVRARDRGGAGIERIDLQERVNGGGFTTVRTWNGISASNGALVTRNWNKVPLASEENDQFRYRVIATDEAGNSTTVTSSLIVQFDLTAPVLGDINSPSPASGTDLLAILSQSFSVSVNNGGGSPIDAVEGYFENYTTQDSYITTLFNSSSDNNPSTRDTLEISPNISDVDGDGSPSNGERDYKFKVTRICDAVGNCLQQGHGSGNAAGIANYSYPVYANTNSIAVKSVTNLSRIDLEDNDNVADGSTENLTVNLQDQFGNRIIPNTSIGREIDFSINSSNSVYLNQLTRSGGSAVYLSSPSNPSIFDAYATGSGVVVPYSDQGSTDGNYSFGFKLYAPTNHYSLNGGADPSSRFVINSMSLSIGHTPVLSSWNASGESIDNATGVDLSFGPMYQSDFTGELEDNGLIEGVLQTSNIGVSKNGARPNSVVSTRKMYLKYNGDPSVLSDLELKYGQTNPPSSTMSTGATLSSDIPSGTVANTTYNLFTRLSQNLGSTIGEIESTFISSHLTYTHNDQGGLNVVLNADVIGRDNYYDTVVQSSTTQAGTKILGLSNSDKIQELTQNQFTDDVRIVGKLTKAGFRKDISQKVLTLTRSVADFSPVTTPVADDMSGVSWTSSSDNNGQIILNNSVIVYKNIGGRYVSIGDSVGTIDGNKTIVVIGGDAYIKGDIINSGSNSILGIIAIKDVNGQGGNIFVDNSVTDLQAILYAEKTLITALGDINSDGYIDTSSSEVITDTTTATELNNQLYIYGSLFSENTIGGSRANPIECPFYLTCIDSIDAQKYDLNYMRRYVRIDTDDDGNPDTVANSGNMSSRATSLGTNQDFPLVIEYNSAIQLTPPPLFK